LEPGTIVSGYRIEGELGRGAMAVVYRAIQLNLERAVALKVLAAELAENDEFVVRFFNEARAAAQLTHPSIIQAYDAGVADDDTYYFAMEYVEGETLHDRITREVQMRPTDALAVAVDIADALDYGWQRQRLTHGDIKPENIMVNKLGETKLADFGLAKVTGHDFDGSEIMLTPLYGAPELIRGQRGKGDCRADIYSFGATLYHMLTGAPPFPGENAHEVMQRHLNEDVIPAVEQVPSIPKDLSAYVDGLLAKFPDGRPSDWHSVKQSLRGLKKAGGRKIIKRAASPAANAAARVAAEKVQQVHDAGRHPAKSQSGGPPILLALGLCLSATIVLCLLAWAAANRRSPPSTDPAAAPRIVVSPAAAAEWATLSNRLALIGDPSEAVALLEAFGARYGESVPAAYTDSLGRWRDTLKWRQAAAAADLPATVEDDETSGGADGSLSAAGGNPARDPTAVVAEVNALTNERGIAPAPEQRLASLENAAAPGEGTGGGEATATLPGGPMTMKDEYTVLLAELAAFRYQVGVDFEPLLRRYREWLIKYAEESPEHEHAAFAVDVVLPSVSDIPAALVSHKGELIGERIPGRKFAKEGKIKALTAEEIQLEKETQYGMALRKVRWEELDDPRYFIYMAKPALGGAALPLEQRRSYLGLLLLTRSFKLWDEALIGVPENPEKRMWMGLKVELMTAEAEGEALKLWRRGQALLKNSEYVNAFACLRQVKASRTAVAFRHREQVEELIRDCEGHVPEKVAGRLVRDAQEQELIDPAASLKMLRQAVVRFGRVDYPERTSIDRIRDRVVQAFPRGNWTENLADSPTGAFNGLWLIPGEPILDVGALMVFQELQKLGRLPGEAKLGLPAFEAVSLFLAGDWAKARGVLGEDALNPVRHLPPGFQGAVWLVNGLLADRYEDRKTDSDAVLKAFKELIVSPRRMKRDVRSQVGAMAVEYALAASGQVVEADEAIFWDEVFAQERSPEPMRFVLDTLSLRIERGDVSEAKALLEEIASDDVKASAYGFRKQGVAFLHGVGTQLGDEDGLRAPRFAAKRLRAQYMRLALSTALRSPGNADAAAVIAIVCDELDSLAVDASPLSGTVCFDVICCLASSALSEGDFTAAVAVVDRGLSLNSAALVPYFPRLCFMKAGFLALSGNVGKGQEVLGTVMQSSVSGRTERLLTRTWEPEPPFRVRDLTKGRADARFWYGWLHFSKAAGGGTMKSPEKSFGQVAEHASSLGLRYVCLSTGAAVDRRGREQ